MYRWRKSHCLSPCTKKRKRRRKSPITLRLSSAGTLGWLRPKPTSSRWPALNPVYQRNCCCFSIMWRKQLKELVWTPLLNIFILWAPFWEARDSTSFISLQMQWMLIATIVLETLRQDKVSIYLLIMHYLRRSTQWGDQCASCTISRFLSILLRLQSCYSYCPCFLVLYYPRQEAWTKGASNKRQ